MLAQFRLGKNRIHWVDKNFVWEWYMSYSRINEPGYASFSSGEKPDKYSEFGFSTIHHMFDGGADTFIVEKLITGFLKTKGIEL